MTTDELLTAYDDQLRTGRRGRPRRGGRARDGPLLWAVFDHGGFVTYRDLGGARGGRPRRRSSSETVAHYRDDTAVASFEWKSRGHDLPADLGERLVAHGFAAEPVETVMIGEASLLAVDVPLAAGGQSSYAASSRAATAVDDLTRMLAAQESVFGTGRGPSVDRRARRARGRRLGVLDRRGRRPGGLRRPPHPVVPGTEFAGIWGGSTLPEFRGRGIYRALVAARARSAVARGVRLHPLRLHRHVAPDPRALGPARGRPRRRTSVRLESLSGDPGGRPLQRPDPAESRTAEVTHVARRLASAPRPGAAARRRRTSPRTAARGKWPGSGTSGAAMR